MAVSAITTKLWTYLKNPNVLRGYLINMKHYSEAFSQQNLKFIESKESFPYTVITTSVDVGSEQEKQEFATVFPSIVEDLVNASADVSNFRKRYVKVLHENVEQEQQTSGILVSTAYRMFADRESQTAENIQLANILGWCANLLTRANLITNDVMHSAEMRNGKQCWYQKFDVGMNALNDATLIANGPYLFLRKYFSELPCYVSLLEWFRCVSSKIAIGHALEHLCMVDGRPCLESFTMDNYRLITKHKTTYPTYLLPIISGIHLAVKYDDELFQQVEDIFSRLGLFISAQNDIFNCYGAPEITTKGSNDIFSGKCTWLVTKALEEATETQKQVLKEHYGKPHKESENKVQAVFAELQILNKFLVFKQDSCSSVNEMICQLPKQFKPEFFRKVVNAAYNLKK